MNLTVGCPVLRREWSIEAWHEALTAAVAIGVPSAPVHPHLVFAGDPDDPTFDIIRGFPNPVTIVPTVETKGDDRRDWGNKLRFRHMAEVRNLLLEEVRRQQPDLFLSLDSDILLAPDALRSAVDALAQHPEWAAVGSRCHLFPTDKAKHPSYAMWNRQGGIRRTDHPGGLFRVDCIFAIKLMRPAAYGVDYAYHSKGEDCGWARNCEDAGVLLGWDGRVCSKHLYKRDELDKVDKLAGF